MDLNTASRFTFAFRDMIYTGLLLLVVFAIWMIVLRLNKIWMYIEKLEKKLEKGLFPYVKHVDEKNDILVEALMKTDKRQTKMMKNQEVILNTLKNLVQKR